MADEETTRDKALRRIIDLDRHGVVDGVEIDLRHELLDPREWKTGLIGYIKNRLSSPFIWFPAFGDFEKENWQERYTKYENLFYENYQDWRIKMSINAYINLNTPEYIVYPGDKIIIQNVECVKSEDALVHIHDAETRYATLCIVRADGDVVKIDSPIAFTSRLSILNDKARFNFDAIFERICDYYKLENIREGVRIEPDGSYASTALFLAISLDWQTEKIKRHVFKESRSKKSVNAVEAWALVNGALALGYLWAQTEAKLGMKPLAEAALRMKAGGSLGGNKSGEARRNKRARTWEPHARELANDIRKEQPSFSQDRVASEIMARWKEADFDPPGHKTLKSLISQMERAGQLPTRKAG